MTIWDNATPEQILDRVKAIVAPHGLNAEFLEGILSVGVQGDDRTYTPVVVLNGPHPGWEILERLSSQISNETPVNRVTFEVATRPTTLSNRRAR